MATTITCDIITPERAVFSGECEKLTLPIHNGMIGVLPGHAPFVSELGVGVVTLSRMTELNQRVDERFAVRDGLVQIVDNRVSVLAVQAMSQKDVKSAPPADATDADERRWHEAQRQVIRND